MEYFKSLTTSALADLIQSTRNVLYICMPSLHPEIVNAIAELNNRQTQKQKNIIINLLIDFDAQTFRQGYGDFESIENLYSEQYKIKSLNNNRISFIISDNVGYYLFIESRSLIPADKETINAVKIDPVSMVRLKNYFFPEKKKIDDIQNELSNAIIEESKILNNPASLISQKPAPVLTLSSEIVKEVKANLEDNPPLKPDFKRIVEFYSNKFQYVKLKFEGANLQYRKVEIPSKALPVMDAKLKEQLETKLNLFDKSGEKEYFKPLNDFKAEIATLREKYLKKVKSREESLLDRTRKKSFEEEVKTLRSKLAGIKSETINKIADQINVSKNSLLTDLVEFLIANPSSLFTGKPNLWQSNKEYVQKIAKSTAEEIIYRIKWPHAHLLVDEFNLTLQYSDITFEDLKSAKFVSELIECELITEKDKDKIAIFGKGIEVKTKA
jgi:hypothetical protein